MKNLLFFSLMVILSIGLVEQSTAQSLLTHGFNNGQLGPFESVDNSNTARMSFVSNRLECTWSENDYNGSNYSKKTEFRADDNAYQFKQEFWTGYWFKIHTDVYSTRTSSDADTEMSLMQIWGFRPDNANWYAMLIYKSDGSLFLRYRHGLSGNHTEELITSNISKNTFHQIVIRIKLAEYNKGEVDVYLNGNHVVDESNCTIGFGDHDSNGQMDGSYSTPGSWGLYNFDNANYKNNETRTVTYDNVSLWNGTNGYNIVKPSGNSFYNRVVTFHKVTNTQGDQTIDANSWNKNTEGTAVHLWTYSSSNNNQKWVEQRRDDGYYRYRKNNSSNVCFDCGGGTSKTLCHLWTCSNTNGNQYFAKEYVLDETHQVRLRRINTSNMYVDGGVPSSQDGTQLKVYADMSNNSTHEANQRWEIQDRGLSTSYRVAEEFFDYLDTPQESTFDIYPNPTADRLTISIGGLEFNHYEIFDMEGRLVKKGAVDPTTEMSVDVNDLKRGQYFLRVSDSKEYFNTFKVIKE